MNPSPDVTPTKLRPPALWLAVLLFLITAALFFRATKGDFVVYDDTTFVNRNPYVSTGLSRDNLAHAFVGMDQVNWEPITTISHILDCQFFKLKPFGHHLISVLIHALNTAGLFLVLRKLTRATWRSFIVAALFGLHPLRVESVAWIAERKDVLCFTFWLLATWAYVRYAEQEKTPRAKTYYRLCLFFFALGLMAKPMLVTFPFFLLLLDYWPLKRLAPAASKTANFKPALLDKIPFLLLTALDCVITFLLQKEYGAVASELPLSLRFGNAVMGYARYLGKFFWPSNLAVLYPLGDRGATAQLLLAAALLIGISIAALALRKRAPWFIVGWLWFLGTLVPVIGLVQVGEQSIADRYTYIPLIGIAVALVWGAHALTPSNRCIWWIAPVTALLVGCSAVTWKQLAYWEDSHALFEHTVQATRNNYVADAILADIYHAHGDQAKAVELLQEAHRANPDFVPATEMMKTWKSEQDIAYGKQLMHQRPPNLDEALPEFLAAKELRVANPDAHYNLGVIYRYKQQLPQAARELKLAVFLMPESYQARRFLAHTLADVGQTNQALREFTAAAQHHPETFEAHADLALALVKAGRRQESAAEAKLALQLHPGEPNLTRLLNDLESH